jgi:phenylalanyl-tRNA synthetase beta subunit
VLCILCMGCVAQGRDEVVRLCDRMQLSAEAGERGDEIIVTVPPFRTDILHECDVIGTLAFVVLCI